MKRDIDLQKLKTSLEINAKQSINKGLPFDNRTLGEIEARDVKIYTLLRQGTVRIKIWDKDE